MPPGFGYGEAQVRSRRRDRDEGSDSGERQRRRKHDGDDGKKDKSDKKKEKKEKRDREFRADEASADRERTRRKDSVEIVSDSRRSRLGERVDGHRHGASDPLGIEDPAAATSAKRGSSPSLATPPSSGTGKRWRDEVAHDDDEDQRDFSTDDEVRDKKLAEARKRREAILAKSKKTQGEEVESEARGKNRVSTAQDGVRARDHDTSCEAKVRSEDNGKETVETSGSGPGGSAVQAKDSSTEQDVSKFILDSRRKQEEQIGGDMFDESKEAGDELKKGMRQSAAIGLTGASGDDWDDEEGYYIAKIGEVMANRYLVVEALSGRGVFSTVVKAKDQQDPEQGLVAIKVMRANDMMTKAAEREVEILERLNSNDKSDKRHIIRLITTFAYRRHFCLVFECMWDDLRAALKKYTKNKGMSMQAVRAYTQQLLIGLAHMHKCQIIHADIKPDNILLNKGHEIVKFCDLGTAVELKDISCSPYLASRFYRPPEVILGCEYSQAVDIWALGCTLYELFTGKTLLQSKTNNDHLKKIMELRGKIPIKVIKKGFVWKNHFTDDLDFKHEGEDENTKQKVIRTVTDMNAKKSVKDLILERVGPEKRQSTSGEDQSYVKRATQFADLLEQMLALDPDKRIRPKEALNHPFLQDGPNKGGGGAGGHK